MTEADTIGPLIGRGNAAEVFALGANVVKLYRPGTGPAAAAGEALAMAVAANHVLPVPALIGVRRYGDRWGIEMGRAEGVPLAQLVEREPGRAGAVLEAMVTLQVQMHARPEARLPALKTRLFDRIGRAPGLAVEQRERLLARLAALPDGAQLCHGDFHPFNLVGQVDAPTIIDWADATSGPAAADACRSYLILKPVVPELAEAYLDRYAVASGSGREAILAWLPCLAAARLTEGLVEQERFLNALAAN